MGAFALGLLVALATVPAYAAGDLDEVERALEAERGNEQSLAAAAAALDHEAAALKRELIAAAGAAQDHEERVTRLEEQLLGLTRRESELSAALDERGATLTATLGALIRLGRQPVEGLIATPAAVDDTIRASLLLGSATTLLEDEARSLRAALEGLKVLHRRVADERLALNLATEGLAAERSRLEALHARAASQAQAADEEQVRMARRVARLAAEADSLRDLLDELSDVTESRAAPQFSAARGSLPMPARGRLAGLFGQGSGQGSGDGIAKGITIETRGGAQVITPYDGEVVYAGRFRGYGWLLIIDHGEGYHTLMSGFSRLDTTIGQWLLAGEPVGVMSRELTGYKVLYVELRHDGVAINPLPWLAISGIKADG